MTDQNQPTSVVRKVCTQCNKDFGVPAEEINCPDCNTPTLEEG